MRTLFGLLALIPLVLSGLYGAGRMAELFGPGTGGPYFAVIVPICAWGIGRLSKS